MGFINFVPFFLVLLVTVNAGCPNNSSDSDNFQGQTQDVRLMDPSIDYQEDHEIPPPPVAASTTPTQRRFIYVATYVDKSFYTDICHNSTDCVDLRMFDIIQHARKLLLLIDVELRETYREVWTGGNPFKIDTNQDDMHDHFAQWLGRAAKTRADNEVDMNILMTGFYQVKKDGDFVFGQARSKSMCRDWYNTLFVQNVAKASFFPQVFYLGTEEVGAILAHEIGHTMGMHHDLRKYECNSCSTSIQVYHDFNPFSFKTEDYCVMYRGRTWTSPPQDAWSTCSVQYLNDFIPEPYRTQNLACFRQRWPVNTCPSKRAEFNRRFNVQASGGENNDYKGLRICAFIVLGLVLVGAAAVIVVAGTKMLRKAMQLRQEGN